MSAVRHEDILFRSGGACLQAFGRPWYRGPYDRNEADAPTFTRADAATCATLAASDLTVLGAVAAKLRASWSDTDADGVADVCGLLLEPTATNVVLYSRDLTNAAWTKTNCAAVKDQTGIDGIASSASKITASAGNGTCLQAIVLASSARMQTAYVKRVAGTGVINMTTDNGATWTAITVTSAWTRVSIPSQTLANPTVGFRIVTNADAIAVDYVQNETGPAYTSPIATTTVAVVRAADALSFPLGFPPEENLTVYARILRPSYADDATAAGGYIWSLGTGASGPRWQHAIGGGLILSGVQGPSGSNVTTTTAIPAGTTIDTVSQLRLASTAPAVRQDVGAGFGGWSAAATAITGGWVEPKIWLGGWGVAGAELGAGVIRMMVLRGAFTLAECQAVAW